mmetsp:Transcript_9238/g.13506  ORF Transcript_9238/g.13506 Transcript_9238/m.13506 type:complete len:148 (+) Transcript_9238:589-1032(+)
MMGDAKDKKELIAPLFPKLATNEVTFADILTKLQLCVKLQPLSESKHMQQSMKSCVKSDFVRCFNVYNQVMVLYIVILPSVLQKTYQERKVDFVQFLVCSMQTSTIYAISISPPPSCPPPFPLSSPLLLSPPPSPPKPSKHSHKHPP